MKRIYNLNYIHTEYINKMNGWRKEPSLYYLFIPTDLVSEMRPCGVNMFQRLGGEESHSTHE